MLFSKCFTENPIMHAFPLIYTFVILHTLDKVNRLLTLRDTEKFICLRSTDFGGNFGLVNERFFKNFELRKVGKLS